MRIFLLMSKKQKQNLQRTVFKHILVLLIYNTYAAIRTRSRLRVLRLHPVAR